MFHPVNDDAGFEFEWDEVKAASNEKKHGVTFSEASTVFADDAAIYVGDGGGAGRMWVIGMSITSRVLVVVYVDVRDDVVRIISARVATKSEKRQYAQGE